MELYIVEIAEKLFPSFSRGPRGVLRRLEPLEGIYGRFPTVDPVAVQSALPWKGIYRGETVGT